MNTTLLDEITNLSRKRPFEEDPAGNMLSQNDPMMGGNVDADRQQQPPCPKRPRIDHDSSFRAIGDDLQQLGGNSPAPTIDYPQELDRLSVEKKKEVAWNTQSTQDAQNNVEPEIDFGNPFQIDPLGELVKVHNLQAFVDDSGYEGEDVDDQNDGRLMEISSNNPNASVDGIGIKVVATYDKPIIDDPKVEDQLLEQITSDPGASSSHQQSALSGSEAVEHVPVLEVQEPFPVPKVTPLMPEVKPDAKRQTRTWAFREKSSLYEMKIDETFNLKFDRECYAMAFAVHSHPDMATKEINARHAIGVNLGKKPKERWFTSPQSCPFTASSGSNDVFYKPFLDKTFGTINGAVLKIDQILSIRPSMISYNECNTDKVQIGKTEIIRQWKLIIIPLTELEFEEIKSQDDRTAITYHQVKRRCYEQRVQFVREIRDREPAKTQRRVEISFPEQEYQFPEISSSKTPEDVLKSKVQQLQKLFFPSMSYEVAFQYLEVGGILEKLCANEPSIA